MISMVSENATFVGVSFSLVLNSCIVMVILNVEWWLGLMLSLVDGFFEPRKALNYTELG